MNDKSHTTIVPRSRESTRSHRYCEIFEVALFNKSEPVRNVVCMWVGEGNKGSPLLGYKTLIDEVIALIGLDLCKTISHFDKSSMVFERGVRVFK